MTKEILFLQGHNIFDKSELRKIFGDEDIFLHNNFFYILELENSFQRAQLPVIEKLLSYKKIL